MAKLNMSIDDRFRDELLRRKRRQATDVVRCLRKRSATLSGKEIVEAVRRDRARIERQGP
ncbi:hypothetical protein [Nitrospira sp. BLG_2]|uniref:hypothetical protein n=1 Tax=Nitrospira sp. BLG_2 TaxID=3397507 RepID=UPI003BA0983B